MKTTSSLSALALSLAAALAAQAANSTPATPALFQRLAKEAAATHPSVQAATARTQAAASAIGSIRLWEDPQLGLGTLFASNMNRQGQGDIAVGVDQMLPRRGLYRAEKSRATAEQLAQAYSLEGALLQELPSAEACGAYKPGEKYVPTEVAVGPDGRLYVADGYGSQFILRFDAAGKYLGKFGGKSDLQPGKFLQAHGLVFDFRGPAPLLLCTERMRNEFQWFTPEGEFVKSVYLPGAFLSRPVLKGDLLMAGVCFGMVPHDFRPKMKRGFVTILDRDNRVISNPGGQAPRYTDAGELLVMLQDQPVFLHGHDVCADDEDNLYVCQWNAGKVHPFKLHRVG